MFSVQNPLAYRTSARKQITPCVCLLIVVLLASANLALARQLPPNGPPLTCPRCTGLGTVTNVSDYGAKGDGITDDYAAIHAAVATLTSGGTLCFPPGSYRIGRGAGRTLFNGGLELAGVHNITVEFAGGAQIYMDNINPATGLGDQAHGILILGGSAGIRLINPKVVWNWSKGTVNRSVGDCIRVYGGGTPASTDVVDDVEIEGGYVEKCPNVGIQTMGATRVKIVNNTIDQSGGDGINANAGNHLMITGNTITSAGDDAIGLITYHGDAGTCLALNCGYGFNSPDITSWNLNGSTVTGNTIEYCVGGIHASGDSDVAIVGNNIAGNAGTGLSSISDKTGLTACSGYGCPLLANKNVVFAGNTVSNTRLGILAQSYNATLYDSDDWVRHEVSFVGNTIRATPAGEDSIRGWTVKGLNLAANSVATTNANSGVTLYETANSSVSNLTITGETNYIVIGDETYPNSVTYAVTDATGEPVGIVETSNVPTSPSWPQAGMGLGSRSIHPDRSLMSAILKQRHMGDWLVWK